MRDGLAFIIVVLALLLMFGGRISIDINGQTYTVTNLNITDGESK